MKFNEFGLKEEILKAIDDVGYVTPSPIQEQAIPAILAAKDVVGCAQTGTGKTAGFAIPILQLLSYEKKNYHKKIKCLILTPTRELAIQIYENFEEYSKYLNLRTTVIFGGVGQVPQVEKIKKGVDILIATPGRLNDLYGQGHIDLSNIEIFVLDEADRMLDMGFVHDVRKVIKCIPEQRQTLLFSATMPNEIKSLANSILTDPVHIEVTPVSSTAQTVSQVVYNVDKGNKINLLKHMLEDRDLTQVLVFSRTKHGADRIAKDLQKHNINASSIHGDKSQTARQNALNGFKQGEVRVLIATDIAARGIDIDELQLVINYDLPNVPETYVHRIGRTGRAGAEGKSISFCNFDEIEYLRDIEKLIGKDIPVEKDNPYPMKIFEATPKQERQPRSQRPSHSSGVKNKPNSKHKKGFSKSDKSKSDKTEGKKYYSSRPSKNKATKSFSTKQRTKKRH